MPSSEYTESMVYILEFPINTLFIFSDFPLSLTLELHDNKAIKTKDTTENVWDLDEHKI